MSGASEDEQYNSDEYSYEGSDDGRTEDDAASYAGALNVGDIEEANEASDEESQEEVIWIKQSSWSLMTPKRQLMQTACSI